MASIETRAQSFKILIRIRTVCLILMIFLLWFCEDIHSAQAILAGWELLFAAMVLSLVFWVLGRIKKILFLLLPLVFLMDSFFVAFWVSATGGPVSFYIPFFLLILVSAILVLTPSEAIGVVVFVVLVFFGSLYLDFIWHIPTVFEAGKINYVSALLEQSPPETRLAVYSQQALRWFFFFLLMIAVCSFLMRQVWSREERLRIREKSLEQKRHFIQMGELTGRIAHGVNTPLGLISGNLELLMAKTRKTSQTYKTLAQIEQYVQRAIRTVRDILDYSRQSMSEIKPVFVSGVIQAVSTAVQSKLKKAGGKLILDVETQLPPVTAYSEGLFQTLLNLVENAIDSIAEGGIVTLSARFQYRSMRLSAHDRRGEIKIVIRDTGRGIPASELKRIFEPFYSTKGFGKGTGLGLAIVKRIVDEHRGEIKVESRVGEGTVFTLLFPTDGLAVDDAVSRENFYYNKPTSSKKDFPE